MAGLREEPWLDFLVRNRPSVNWQEVGLVLCLDPGETTGWARFIEGRLLDWGQEPTGQSPGLMAELIRRLSAEFEWWPGYPELNLPDWGYGNRATYTPSRIVYEEYRVRGNKFREHVGSEVVTIQHIGAIKVVADELSVPLSKQTASMAKGFATDRHLKAWGLYQVGRKHSNDAIRHGVYWHLFAAGRKPVHRSTGGLHNADSPDRE